MLQNLKVIKMLDCLQSQFVQPQDVYFMELALAQARKGELTTRPNPAVGCVLVKNDVVIGEGFHPKAGEPHAEVFALRHALTQGYQTAGATAYVTLEPCSHTGRTPPCAKALIDAGISKVVIATTDPNPKVAGRGVTMLKNAGIEVVLGVCQQAAKQLNVGFLKAMATGLPFVRLKVACSLDGKTAMVDGSSKWITSDEARQDVQKLRAKSAAIITGSGTILADDPALSVRSLALGVPLEQIPTPKIVVVDRRARLDTRDAYQAFRRDDTLLWRGDLTALLKVLVAEHQCYDVLVEAGAKLSGAFIEQHLVDELIVYQAPCVLGHQARSLFEMDIDKLTHQRRFELIGIDKVGKDIKQVLHPLY